MPALFFIMFLVLLIGVALLWWGRRTQQQTGLPVGSIIYSDTGAEETVREPILSRRYGLVGKPDYLVHTAINGQSVTIPVEVKSRSRPAQVYENHTLQLGVYCLLIEEKFGVAPPYGLLRYRDATLQVEYNERLRQQVLSAAEALRRGRLAADVHRQHAEPERCQHCGYRHACGEEL